MNEVLRATPIGEILDEMATVCNVARFNVADSVATVFVLMGDGHEDVGDALSDFMDSIEQGMHEEH